MSKTKSLPPTFINGWSNEEIASKINYKRLGNTEIFVPILTLGGAHVTGTIVFDDNGELLSGYESVVESIQNTIKSGINYIDTSPLYGCGKAEIVLGKALAGVPRKAYYLATKVGRKGDCTFDFSAQWAKQSVQLSLKKLGVTYLDVIQVHDIEFADNLDIVINETLPALDELRNKGIVKYIGITGYPLEPLKEVIERSKVKVDLVLSYCRCAPYDQTLLNYIPFFKEKGLGVINAAVLGMGLLTNRPLPFWHPAKHEISDACKRAAEYCRAHNVDISKISVYYAIQQQGIDTHLIGMEDTNALNANISVIINGISEEENRVLQYILREIFAPLEVTHWEGIEVTKYRNDKDAFSRFLRGE